MISGFGLAHGPLKKSYAGNPSGAIAGLGSSIVRRPFRLFLPGLPVMLIAALHRTFNIYYINLERETWWSNGLISDQLYAVKEWLIILWRPLLGQRITPTYAPQLWTLPVELRGSLMVFMVTMMGAKMKPAVRIAAVTLFALDAFIHQGQTDVALFLTGFIMADIRHFRATLPRPPPMVQRVLTVVSYVALVTAVFLVIWSTRPGQALSIKYVSALSADRLQQQVLVETIAAVMLLFAMESLPTVQKAFNTPLSRYLGDVSFAIYLVHWVVLYGVGKYTIHSLRDMGFSNLSSWAMATGMEFAITFWFSDWYWRMVDLKSSKVARWVADIVGA
jgi:peptidoglycan/LPS O-acetylase OafA/YrhL